jgi:transposase
MNLNICLKLLQFKAQELTEEEGNIYIEGELENTVKACPECHKEDAVIHQYYQKQIRHLPIFGRPAYLVFQQANLCCQNCHNTYLEQVDFLENHQLHTKPYQEYLYELGKKQDISRVAELEGLSWDTANRIFLKKKPKNAKQRLT